MSRIPSTLECRKTANPLVEELKAKRETELQIYKTLDPIPQGLYKNITTYDDMSCFFVSPARSSLMTFIQRCAEVIMGYECYHGEGPDFVRELGIYKNLEELERLVKSTESTPLEELKGSFGDVKFRDVYDEMRKTICNGSDEVNGYFYLGWGDRTRLDFGTGHELNFFCALFVEVIPFGEDERLKEILLCE